MENLPERANESLTPLPHAPPPLLVRAGMYALLPVLLTLALPLLLLFVMALYLLALIHGARVFVFRIGTDEDDPDYELQKPHFLDIEVPAKVVDEPRLPKKG